METGPGALPLVEIEAKGVIDVNSVIGARYRILSCLGKGGMGIVYKASDLESDKLVAIKLLFADRVLDAQSIARFQQEVKAASLLEHPCLAKVYDSGIAESGQPYLVMDLIEGTTLAAKIAQVGQLPIAEALKIFILVCDGLAHAHDHHILHRDLKPSNIMLTTGGDNSSGVKILDFGLAKFKDPSEQQSLHITHTGELVGSPLYMSPEQARGVGIDERSDLYSLGCSLYEALTGGPPHIGHNPISTLLKRETDQPLSLTEGSLGGSFSQQVELVVTRLLNLNPVERYQSAREVRDKLLKLLNSNTHNTMPAAVISPPPETKEPPKRQNKRQIAFIVAASAAMLALLGLISFHFAFNKQYTPAPDHTFERMPEQGIELPKFDLKAKTELGQGINLRESKQFDQSAKVIQDAIVNYRKNFGPDSEAEADAYQELATTYLDARKANEAYDALRNALRLSNKFPSLSDGRLARLMEELARFYVRQFEIGKANMLDRGIELYTQAANLYQRPIIDNKADAGKCLLEIGKSLIYEGRYREAKEKLQTALALLDQQHPGQRICANGLLAQCYRNEGKFPEASDYDSEAVRLFDQIKKPDLQHLCDNINHLAFDYVSLHEKADKKSLNAAEALYNRVFITTRPYPQYLRECRADALEGMGAIYEKYARDKDIGAYEKSRQYYEAALKLRETVHPPDVRTAILYEKRACLERLANNFSRQRQLQYFQMALEYAGPELKHFTGEQLNIARDYRSAHLPEYAEAICTQVKPIVEHKLGHDSIESANT